MPVPMQFQDGGDLDLEGQRYPDDGEFMTMLYGTKRLVLRPTNVFYMVTVLTLLQQLDQNYVTKMQYNKDRDLIFVSRPNNFWNEFEYVYEVHHLEQMVPSPVTSIPKLSANRDDGILTVTCMHTQDQIKLYNEEKYWNVDVRDEFMDSTTTLWKGLGDKYDGHIFKVPGPTNEEF